MKRRLAFFSLGHQALLLVLWGSFITTLAQAQHITSRLKSASGRRGFGIFRISRCPPATIKPSGSSLVGHCLGSVSTGGSGPRSDVWNTPRAA